MTLGKNAPRGNRPRPARPNPVTGCPLTAALAAIGGKWKLILVYWLAESPRHFAALRRAMPGMTPKVLAEQLQELVDDGLVAREPEGRAPAREGTVIAAPDGREVGVVTSGGFGPTVNGPVAMGYVLRELSAPGTELHLMVRGKPLPARVAPMPFAPHRYKR